MTQTRDTLIRQIGGFTIRSRQAAAMRAWYEAHLGLRFDGDTVVFRWADPQRPALPGHTLLRLPDSDGDQPDGPGFSVSFRVSDIRQLQTRLDQHGITTSPPEKHTPDLGPSLGFEDPDGLRMELWQADDERCAAKTVHAPGGIISGIGGIYYRVADPLTYRSWYDKLFRMESDIAGVRFERGEADGTHTVFVQWSVGSHLDASEYFAPSQSAFMLNLTVHDMDTSLRSLERGKVNLLGDPEVHEHGIFAWIMDPDGNKLELWQPNYDPDLDESLIG